VSSGPIGKLYCGKSRPGFFDGILTAVTIHFHITQPHRAYFGEKDFQQLFLIRQMVRDFRFPIEIVGMPTLREQSDLAMSSRNTYLNAAQREIALCVYKAIEATKRAYSDGDTNALSLVKKARTLLAQTAEFAIDYVHIVDERTLLDLTGEVSRPARMLVAGYMGERPRVRLIDNDRIN
jgi:pantoate--beta-alanine ligase